MSTLDGLRIQMGAQATRRLHIDSGHRRLATLFASLKAKGFGGSTRAPGPDQRTVALHRFLSELRVDSPRDGRLVSFSLTDGLGGERQCLMERRNAFDALLDDQRGVGQWRSDPRQFRRCYQGLLSGYFLFDAFERYADTEAASNWDRLRRYLKHTLGSIRTLNGNPLWVELISANSQLLDEQPCDFLGAEMLKHETRRLTELRQGLNIPGGSWFLRDVILAQIHAAARQSDEEFVELLPVCLLLVNEPGAPADRGLAEIVNRYSRMGVTPVDAALQDALITRWGNPFLHKNLLNWRRAAPEARRMVQQWLTRDCILEFFELLSVGRVGDSRRAKFWLNYAKSIDNVYFALGQHALQSEHPDFISLRKRMSGMYSRLSGAGRDNNAFIMTMGNLVVVEFGDTGACYGYDRRIGLPFTTDRELSTVVDAGNSLKHRVHTFKLRHQDNILGYERWESRIEDQLLECGIANSFVDDVLRPQAAQWNVRVTDERSQGGYLWVHVDNGNTTVNRQLLNWDFTFRPGRGWFKR